MGAATEAFVKYCRVDVQSFDRSMELYSKGGAKNESEDVSSHRIVRAKTFVSRAVPEGWYFQKLAGAFKASVMLKVPKEEFDRISKERSVTLAMDILFYCEDEKGKMQAMDENAVLASGYGYSIYINPSDICYLYVYQIDALGKSFRLFPNNKFETAENPIEPSVGMWLPNERKLYSLDETTGKEFVYVFASREPISEFDGASALEMDKVNLDKVIKLKKMGIAGLKDKIDPAKLATVRSVDIKEVKKKLVAEGVFVWETWFWHK